ncbi:hypothetical protein RND81_10G051800 [Saponaria officinalis]|uniref:Uncharacterized protein n=1 Tax=Saponaria officinalis TaxID=3572 RepID=A0AAW1I0S7_SAPOF
MNEKRLHPSSVNHHHSPPVTTPNIECPTDLPSSNNATINPPELFTETPLSHDHHITHPITTPHHRQHHYSPNDDHRSPRNHTSKRRNIPPAPYPSPPKNASNN